MKILIDARPLQTYSRFRGIGRYVNELIEVFKDQPDVYFLFFKGTDIDTRPKNIVLINIPRRGITYTDRFFLNRVLKKNRISLFHSTAFALPGKLESTRMVLTIHDLTPLLFPEFSTRKNRFIFSRVVASAERADQVVAVSGNTREDLIRLVKIPGNRIRVVYSPVNIQNCQVGPEKLTLDNVPEEFVLYAGGFDGNKNVKTIVKALNIFKKPLVMAGMISKEVKQELTTLLEPEAKSMIHFTGFVSDCDLSALYKKSRVFLFPSIYEGFGFPPLEALKMGTPSVVSTYGSLKEVLKDAAMYVEDPLNPIELAEKTTALWNDKAKRDELAVTGRQVLSHYSTARFKEDMMDIYLSLLKFRD